MEAAYVAAGIAPDAVLWREPLALIGWLVAQNLKRQGVKGVGRPIDFKAVKAAIERATANGD